MLRDILFLKSKLIFFITEIFVQCFCEFPSPCTLTLNLPVHECPSDPWRHGYCWRGPQWRGWLASTCRPRAGPGSTAAAWSSVGAHAASPPPTAKVKILHLTQLSSYITHLICNTNLHVSTLDIFSLHTCNTSLSTLVLHRKSMQHNSIYPPFT